MRKVDSTSKEIFSSSSKKKKTMETDGTTPNLILEPHLYLCSRIVTYDQDVLAAHNIQYVLNVTDHVGFQWKGIIYRHINAQDISKGFDLSAHFSEAFAFISIHPFSSSLVWFLCLPPKNYLHTDISLCKDEAKENGAAVLVHCELGVSRSATIVIAWLIKHAGMTLKEAFAHTKQRRRVIMPNEGALIFFGLFQISIPTPPLK